MQKFLKPCLSEPYIIIWGLERKVMAETFTLHSLSCSLQNKMAGMSSMSRSTYPNHFSGQLLMPSSAFALSLNK